MNIEGLPLELKHKVFLSVLQVTDISTVALRVPTMFLGTIDSGDGLKMLDPKVFRNLWYCYHLFQASKKFDWIRHVRFMFPTSLAMLDVFGTWPEERLRRVRYVRLYGKPFYYDDEERPTEQSIFSSDTSLNALDLRLEHLEYEPVFSCIPHSTILETRGWKKFSFLRRGPMLGAEDVQNLMDACKAKLEQTPEVGLRLNMPYACVQRDSTSAALIKYEGPQLHVPQGPPHGPRTEQPSWPSGASVYPQVVVEKNTFEALSDVTDLMQLARIDDLEHYIHEEKSWAKSRKHAFFSETDHYYG